MKMLYPLLVTAVATLAGCASFRPTAVEDVPFKERAQSQTEGNVTVRAVVLGADETEAVFGAPLYKRGIQPVWLEITNNDDKPVWYLHVGTDPDYFPPLEVAYMHKSGLSGTDREAMDRYYHDHAIGKHVAPGAMRSGFLFTNLELGTKDFNVDLIGEDKQVRTFTFFCNVPGFRMDHEDVDWDNIYPDDEIVDLDEDGLRIALAGLPCCTTNADGAGNGDPLNVVIVGSDDDVYHAMIRTGWDETGSLDTRAARQSIKSGQSGRYEPARPLYVFGRRQDIALRSSRENVRERNELRLWLTPLTLNGQAVWVGQIGRRVGARGSRNYKVDADVDEARTYLMQKTWYAHKLDRLAYVDGVGANTPSEQRRNLDGDGWFTDGLRVVLWVSSVPVAFEDVEFVEWDQLAPDEKVSR
jgi:hypothetical protein